MIVRIYRTYISEGVSVRYDNFLNQNKHMKVDFPKNWLIFPSEESNSEIVKKNIVQKLKILLWREIYFCFNITTSPKVFSCYNSKDIFFPLTIYKKRFGLTEKMLA
jgi:hypothetical protein